MTTATGVSSLAQDLWESSLVKCDMPMKKADYLLKLTGLSKQALKMILCKVWDTTGIFLFFFPFVLWLA